MKKFKTTKIDKELYDLLHYRKQKFGTSLREESANLVRMTEQISQKLGLDLKNAPVKKTFNLKSDKRVFILK